MDNLLNSMFEVFTKLLPFIRCLALIALIVLMHKIIMFLHDIQFTLKKVNETVDGVNGSIEKFQEPIETVRNISRSADKVNDFSNKAVSDAIVFISENFNAFLDWLKEFFEKTAKKQTPETAEDEVEEIEEEGGEAHE